MGSNHSWILGFHGCEKETAASLLLRRKEFTKSTNAYDWLGSGFYCWENDPQRAFEFATEVKACKEPFVVGAILDLGYCLDLTCRGSIDRLSHIWDVFLKDRYLRGEIRPNKEGRKGETGELLLRFLDCKVIETLHAFNEAANMPPYDSVRAAFWEGPEIYPTAGFYVKNHIQICVRNPKCLLGFFLPKGWEL